MHTIGKYTGASRTLDGDLLISFAVDADSDVLEKLERQKGKELVIDTKLHRQKRSLTANAYFWKLCDEVSRVLGSDKDTVYMMMLEQYGVFNDIEIISSAVETMLSLYRYAQEIDRYKVFDLTGTAKEMVTLRCYIGSSQYDTAEMSHLINGIVHEAQELGIDTWTREELDYLVSQWRATHENEAVTE